MITVHLRAGYSLSVHNADELTPKDIQSIMEENLTTLRLGEYVFNLDEVVYVEVFG